MKEINKALICDSELMALYKDLCELTKSMNDAQLQPSSTTVLNILSYSKNYGGK